MARSCRNCLNFKRIFELRHMVLTAGHRRQHAVGMCKEGYLVKTDGDPRVIKKVMAKGANKHLKVYEEAIRCPGYK